MAQPNVAREPSMDEILASIRRIIESNEPPLGAPPVLTQPASVDGASDDDSFDDESFVADFHAEEARHAAAATDVEAIAPLLVQGEARMAQPAMSLADVAARVRAASERSGMLPREANSGGAATAEPATQRNASPLTTAHMMPTGAAGANTHGAVMAGEDFRPSRPIVDAYEAPLAEPVESGAVVSLVSPSVGAQVASSFGALAEALEAGPRRSFDEIAEEMLRPMLQEWLDDNLPTLVERLVREEIARVARGPRR